VLTPAEVDDALEEQHLHWSREGDVLVTTVTLHDFAAALSFVNTVGAAAEAANHHPDIDIRWNKVRLSLTTHDSVGLTLLDLALAGASTACVPTSAPRRRLTAVRPPARAIRPAGPRPARTRPDPGDVFLHRPVALAQVVEQRSIWAGSAEKTSSRFSIDSRPSGYFRISLARSRSMASPLSA